MLIQFGHNDAASCTNYSYNYKVTTEYPDGSPSSGHTHFQQEGAQEVARMVFEGLQSLAQVKVEKDIDTSGISLGSWLMALTAIHFWPYRMNCIR